MNCLLVVAMNLIYTQNFPVRPETFETTLVVMYSCIPCGLQEYCTLDSFVNFGAICIICLFTSYASPLILFSSLFSLLIFSFENTEHQAGGHKRRPNLGFLVVLVYFYVIVFFVFLMHDYLYSVSLGLLYIFVVISSVFLYLFSE